MKKIISSLMIITFFVSTIDRAHSVESSIVQKMLLNKIKKEFGKTPDQKQEFEKQLLQTSDEMIAKLDKISETQFSDAMNRAAQTLSDQNEIEKAAQNINSNLSTSEKSIIETADEELCLVSSNCTKAIITKEIIKSNSVIIGKIKTISKAEFKNSLKDGIEKSKSGNEVGMIILAVFVIIIVLAGLITLTYFYPTYWLLFWLIGGSGGGGVSSYIIIIR